MKRILLLLVLFLGTYYFTKAQVIDIVGKGTNGELNSNLQFTNLVNIDHIDVGVIKSWGPSISASDVTFSNFNGNGVTVLNSDIINKSSFPSSPGEYLTSSFTDIDATGIDVSIKDDTNNFKNYIQSYYAFVYRNTPTSTIKSFTSLETVYYYRNSSFDPYVYNIPIDAGSGVRDINVKIPISELKDDNRPVIIDITAGPITEHAEINTYNLGNSLFIGEYSLKDVPGNITNVTVSIYSPDKSIGEANGDSFYTNGIIVDVDLIFDGCTLTQGYWKTHSSCKAKGPERDDTWDNLTDGEDTSFFLSNQNYCEVFDTKPGKGGKYYILAHQYIAAQLNLFNNSDPTDVAADFNESTIFLNTYTPQEVKGNKTLEDKCVALGGVLADFNEGAIGPGHCDDSASIEPVKQAVVKERISIYPNPASSYSKIEFTPKHSSNTSVELYNINGQKVAALFNKNTKKGVPVSIEYDTQNFSEGLYFAIIKNGFDVYNEKISIVK